MPYRIGSGGAHSGALAVGSQQKKLVPTQTTKKSISYVAGGADSNLLISISGTDASDAITTTIPSAVEVTNTGVVPTIVISQYEGYSDEDTDAGRHTLQTMLMPKETLYREFHYGLLLCFQNALLILQYGYLQQLK